MPKQTEIVLYEHIKTKSKIMQYLMKIKYKGNPNPINSICFELLKSGISFFMIGLRQHGHIRLEENGFIRSSTRPGLFALACSSANFQSGGIISRSIISHFEPTSKVDVNQKKLKKKEEVKFKIKQKRKEINLSVSQEISNEAHKKGWKKSETSQKLGKSWDQSVQFLKLKEFTQFMGIYQVAKSSIKYDKKNDKKRLKYKVFGAIHFYRQIKNSKLLIISIHLISKFSPIIIIPAFSLSSIILSPKFQQIPMNIERSSHRKIYEAKRRDTPFYDLFEAEEDIVTELTTLINSLFAPLTWILEETLYQRVQKEDKGWISIDFLHRNQKFQSILKKFEIPAHCQRRKNIINKAIKQSLIKRKRNLIKRKEHIRITEQVKKVLYLEKKATEPSEKDLEGKQLKIQNIMSEKVLRELIAQSLKEILHARKESQNPNLMEIDDELNKHKHVESMLSEIVFQGSLNKEQTELQRETSEGTEVQTKKQNIENEPIYSWCFIYFPSLQQHQMHTIFTSLERFISRINQPEKMELQKQLSNLNLAQINISQSEELSKDKNINICTLREMINQQYPKYNQVCEAIGYTRIDYRKQALKVKQKVREMQKIRLLQSRYLDDKVDLANMYHVKLEIQKEKKTYWDKKNKKIEQRNRKRQERRRNRLNRSQHPQIKKDLTQKLKQLLDIDQPKPFKQKQQPKDLNPKIQLINENSMNDQSLKDHMKEESIQSEVNANGPGFKIMLPRINHGEQNQHEINSESDNLPENEEKNTQNAHLNLLYEEEDNQDDYDFQNSSGEEFQLPKKRKRNNNSQNNKHKKIVKNNQTKPASQKQQTEKKSAQKNPRISDDSHSSRNGNTQSHLNKKVSNSNNSYNLRHKSPVQGSYLKMAGYAYDDEEYSKKEKNHIYEDDEDDRPEQSNGRNSRLRRS